MIKITYKGVYHLLEGSYARRTLNEFIYKDIPENVFESSKVFAEDKEDYSYLNVMVTKRDQLDKDYVIFINSHDSIPITLIKDKDFNLLELAILCRKCQDITQKQFEDLIEQQAEYKWTDKIDPQECIKQFREILALVDNLGQEEDLN